MTILQEVGETLVELQKMHQLNLELLEQLNVACAYLLSNNISLPNQKTFAGLLRKADALMDEIQADEPKLLQYNKLKKHPTGVNMDSDSDEKLPEPGQSRETDNLNKAT